MLMISSFPNVDAGIKCIIMMMVMIMMQMQGKDYIALLSLDGTLAIFEQESHSFSRCHPHHHHRLRTARVHILYSFKADTFLTSESLQCDQIFSCYLGQLVCCEIEQQSTTVFHQLEPVISNLKLQNNHIMISSVFQKVCTIFVKTRISIFG